MPIPVSAIGEQLVAEMVKELRGDFLDICQLREIADERFIAGGSPIVFVEQALMPIDEKRFDGASRVDVVVRLSEHEAIPFEVKLGLTRLSKTRIGKDWLQKCRLSHGGRRICGNMMAILERNLPEQLGAKELHVKLPDNSELRLTEQWFVIVKRKVLKRWHAKGRPAFSEHVRFLSFETIVETYGGKARFNELVRKILEFDYYDKWVKGIDTAEN